MAELAQLTKGQRPQASWYKQFGLGGMTREVEFMMKNLFLPKFNPVLQQRLASMGVINGGMLLYGPPGSGKTFLCNKTAEVWRMADPDLRVRHVHGPELFSELVGSTEKAVRELFSEAQENYENHMRGESQLHQYLVIIDEIDSMF